MHWSRLSPRESLSGRSRAPEDSPGDLANTLLYNCAGLKGSMLLLVLLIRAERAEEFVVRVLDVK